MVDLINAIFFSFWTFAGTFLLLGLIVKGIAAVAAAVIVVTRRPEK